jgi:hypothetical protein
MEVEPARALRRLAEMNGVQPSFLDAAGERQRASPEVLCALLHALGIPAGNETEKLDSLRASLLRPFRQVIEPAVIAWDGRGNVEDLWLERRPQNVPGTSRERPNWRRKTRFTLEKMLQNSGLRKMLSI